jgi:hypothetical protein
MREADFSTQHQRYHVLSAATLSNGDNRNFVHMKVMVDAGYPLHSRFAKNRLQWRARLMGLGRMRRDRTSRHFVPPPARRGAPAPPLAANNKFFGRFEQDTRAPAMNLAASPEHSQ